MFFRRPAEETDRVISNEELYLCDSGAQFKYVNMPLLILGSSKFSQRCCNVNVMKCVIHRGLK